MKPVAILGCGPSGLLAAHAAGAIAGQPVVIFSHPAVKSRLGGAQFLHEPIPELTGDEPDAIITYRVSGSSHLYQKKAYGMGAQPSFVSFDGVHDGMQQPGWNLRKIYDVLWNGWGDHINQEQLDYDRVRGMVESDKFSLVVSSVPLRFLCRSPMVGGTEPGNHFFAEQEIAIMNGQCNGGFEDNTIWYSGDNDLSWYRSSRLWGVESTEWGKEMGDRLPYGRDALVRARKPVRHNCDCHPPELVKVGRFGRWQKGVLVQDAFRTTVVALYERGLLAIPEKPRPS